MSESIFDVTMVEMPTVLPVLPFAGTFLFPGQKLQLRIFETRYIRLIFNALASSRIVAMIQPVDKVSTEDKPKLYSVGCAGRISSFAEAENNLLLITLTGLSRFRVVKEIDSSYQTYRTVTADYSDFAHDLNPEAFKFDRRSLFAKLDTFAYSNKIDLNSALLKNVPDSALMAALASMLPFETAEKQALLECNTPQKFYNTLMMLLDMSCGSKTN